MKKVLALVLAILLMCSFCMIAACGKDKPNPKPPIDNPGGIRGARIFRRRYGGLKTRRDAHVKGKKQRRRFDV